MLVTFTNSSSAPIYLSAIYKELAVGESVQTHRSPVELDKEQQLKVYVLAGDITLAFALEAGDSITPGFGLVPKSYTNGTRPAANTVPTFTPIWNSSDSALNFSDGAQWRDALGVLT